MPWLEKGFPDAWRVIAQAMQLSDFDAPSFDDGDVPQWDATAGKFVGVATISGGYWSRDATTPGSEFLFPTATQDRIALRTTAPTAILEITGSGSTEPGLWVHHFLGNSGLDGPPPSDLAPLRLSGTYVATDNTKIIPAGDLAYTGIRSDLVYGSLSASPLGTAHTFTATLDVLRSGDPSNQHAVFMGWLRYGDQTTYHDGSAPVARASFASFNLHGPIGAQPRLLTGVTMFVNNYYNGNPTASSGPSAAYWAITKPATGGGGETHAGATTYPLNVGFGVAGYSGPPASIPELANQTNLRTRGWDTAFKAGGYGSGYQSDADSGSGAAPSLIGVGFEGTDVQLAGLKLYNPLTGSNPKGIWFGTDTGSRAWDWLFYFNNGAANVPLTGALMLPGDNSDRGMIAWGSDGTPVRLWRSANQQMTLLGGLRCFVTGVVMNPLARFGTAGNVDPTVIDLTTASGTLRLFQAHTTGLELVGAGSGEGGLKSASSALLLGAGSTLVQRLDSSGNTWLARELRFGELLVNGSNYVGFKAPDALGSNAIWTLPSADGMANQVLQTDGSGTLFFGTVSSGTNFWARDLTGGEEFLYPATTTDKIVLGRSTAPASATQLFLQPTVATRIGQTIQGQIGQSADYQQWQNNVGLVEGRFLPGGHFWIAGEARFNELTGNGPNYVGFQAPDDLTTSTIWTLPDSDGTDGQVIVTDGAGNLTWGDALAADGPFVFLTPATTARNVVNPSVDGVVALTLNRVNPHDQSGDVLRLQLAGVTRARFTTNSDNTPEQGYQLYLDGGTSGHAVFRAPVPGDTVAATPVLDGFYNDGGIRHGFRISTGGWYYGGGIGSVTTTNVNTGAESYYQHISLVPGDRQVFAYSSWLLNGAGHVYFSPGNTWNSNFAADTNGSVIVSQPGSGASGLGVRSGSWANNGRVFETQSPGATVRSYFGGFGNLVIHLDNGNGGINWNNTTLLSLQFETGGGANMVANALEYLHDSELRWNVLPTGGQAMRGELRFQEQIANGNNYVGFKAPATLTGDLIWTLPATDGTAGQTLVTSGTGGGSVLSWSTPSGSADLAGAVIIAPDSVFRNLVIPTADYVPLTLQGGGAGAAALQIWRAVDTTVLGVFGGDGAVVFRSRDATTTTTSQVFTLTHKSTATTANGFGGEMRLNLDSSAGGDRFAGSLIWQWATALDTSRTGRLVFSAYDWIAPREGLRIESDGANALLGIGGAVLAGARAILYSPLSASKGLVLRGVASQSGALLETQDSAGARETQTLPGGHLWLLRELRLGELATNGSNYVGFKAPDALAADKIWTLPSLDGTDGQFLKTDGLGNLGWASASTGGVTDHGALTGLSDDDHLIYAVVAPTTATRNVIQPTSAPLPAMIFRGFASQSGDLVQWQETGQNVLAAVSSIGQGFFRPRDAVTNAVTIALNLAHRTTGTAANGFGSELRLGLDANPTQDRPAGSVIWEWSDATDASRKARLRFAAYDWIAPREGLRIESDGANALLGIGGAVLAGARTIFYGSATGDKTLVLRQVVSQSGAVLEAQDSSAARELQVLPGGHLWLLRELRLGELAANGNNYVGFRAANTLGSDTMWTLPSADGTPGQVLTTSGPAGGGILSWTTVATGGTDLSGAVILAPNSPTRNVVVPTNAAFPNLILRDIASQTADLLQFQDATPITRSIFNAAGQLALGAAVTNSHMLRVFQTGSTGSGSDDTLSSFLPFTPLWVDQNVTTIDAGGGPDVGGLNLRTNYTAANPLASDLTHTGMDSRIRYGTRASWADATGTQARGTVHSFTSVVDILNSADSSANEFANFMGYARFRGDPGTSGSLWFMDLSAHGPINTQPGLLNGITMLINNYYNGLPIRGPSAAMWLVTQPGAGAGAELGHNTATTYPVEYGLAIIGSSTGGVGFRDAIHIGSGVHPWKPSGTSSLERGIHIEGVTSEAIRLVGGNIGIVWGNEGGGGGKMRLDRPALYELQLGNVTDGGLFRVWGRESVANDPILHLKTTALRSLTMKIEHGAGGTLNSASLGLVAAPNEILTGGLAGDTVIRASSGRLLIGKDGATTYFVMNNGSVRLGTGGLNPTPSALMELVSTTQGFKPPGGTTTQRLAIAATESLLFYDSSLHNYYFHDGTNWIPWGSGTGSSSSNWTSAAGVIYPTTTTDRVLIRTTIDPGAGVSLAVNGVGSSNDPIAQFYTAGVADSNSVILKNGTGSLKWFVSGASNTFMPGTLVGDVGLIPSGGRLHIGSSSAAAWFKVNNGSVGVGMPQGVDPSSTLDVRGRLGVAPVGVTPDVGYPGPLTITRAAANSGQFINLIRSATIAWGLGLLPNSNVFAVGLGNSTDTSFTSFLSLDTSGRLLVGRTGAPNAGYSAEFYSDPAAPSALGVPLWNNVFERDGIPGAQQGMIGYQADNQTFQYHDLTTWRTLARVDQIINVHGALQGLDADDHAGYFWQAGRSYVQILIGGTLAEADLVLQSTSHGAKGFIMFGSSAYNEATQRLGLRRTDPQYTLDVNGDVRFATSLTGILRADAGVISVDSVGFSQNWSRDTSGAAPTLKTTIANDRVLVGSPPGTPQDTSEFTVWTPGTTPTYILTAGAASTRLFAVQANGGISLGTGDASASQVLTTGKTIKVASPPSNLVLDIPTVTGVTLESAPNEYMAILVSGVTKYVRVWDVQVAQPPAQPNNLTATPISSSEIDLAWNDNSSDETGFKIERGPDGTSWTEIAQVGANVTAYQNTGLSASNTYHYRVRAYNGAGNSAYSNEAVASTGGAAAGIKDDFNRTSVTFPLGTPTGGQSGLSWSYSSTGQLFGIIDGDSAYNSGGGGSGGNYACAWLSNQTATGTIRVTIKSLGASHGGVVFRYDPITTVGYVISNTAPARWGVYEFQLTSGYGNFIGGVKQTDTAPADGDILEIDLVAGSNSVGFRQNGSATKTYTTLVNNTGAGIILHGLFADRTVTAGQLKWTEYLFTPG